MERFKDDLELDISFAIGDLLRFRVNVYRDRMGVCAALRTIYESKPAQELGIDPRIADLALLPRGLVLVCGPTGSGKSTTLAAIVDKANAERADHIITIEDPIEFVHQHKRCVMSQREVGTDTKSFAEALKRALREDPDIIEVGELRDLETISTATRPQWKPATWCSQPFILRTPAPPWTVSSTCIRKTSSSRFACR